MSRKKVPFGGWATALISVPISAIGGFIGGLFTLYGWLIEEEWSTVWGALYGACCSGGLAIVFFLISVVDSSDIFQYKPRNVMLFFSSIAIASVASTVIGSLTILATLDLFDQDLSATAFFTAPFVLSIPISLIVIRVMHLLFMKSDPEK